ncbi:hypothetical protein D3C81_1538690 [compost metagenome]
MPAQTVRMSSSSGTPTAHRKTFDLAQLDTISSQPTVGKAHRQYTGSKPNTRSGPRYRPGVASSSANTWMPLAASTPLRIRIRASEVRLAAAATISGATSRAMAAFDSTVCASEMGSDFQNSTLRSRRSSCRALRQ